MEAEPDAVAVSGAEAVLVGAGAGDAVASAETVVVLPDEEAVVLAATVVEVESAPVVTVAVTDGGEVSSAAAVPA